MGLSRRAFLGTPALAAAGAALPSRVLGRTGARVPVLGYGCGSSWRLYGGFDDALATLSRALDLGVTYIDTAASYGDGQSEKVVGALMKTRRREVWLSTKTRARGYDEALRAVDESLARLETGQVDLLHIHDLQGPDDLAAIEAPRGVLKAAYRMRDEKKARFIGITSHSNPEVMRMALERHDFDCAQMSLNPALAGRGAASFESLALPVAVKKRMGVLAMKVFAQSLYQAPPEGLMRYALSLPVSAAVVGMPARKVLEENVRLAAAFRPMAQVEMREMARRLTARHGAALARFFEAHADV